MAVSNTDGFGLDDVAAAGGQTNGGSTGGFGHAGRMGGSSVASSKAKATAAPLVGLGFDYGADDASAGGSTSMSGRMSPIQTHEKRGGARMTGSVPSWQQQRSPVLAASKPPQSGAGELDDFDDGLDDMW